MKEDERDFEITFLYNKKLIKLLEETEEIKPMFFESQKEKERIFSSPFLLSE